MVSWDILMGSRLGTSTTGGILLECPLLRVDDDDEEGDEVDDLPCDLLWNDLWWSWKL